MTMLHPRAPASSYRSQVSKKAARTRAANRLERINPNTTDPNQAVAFELHSRGLTVGDLAARLKVSDKYLHERFSGTTRARSFTPALLKKVIEALHIPPRRARELHALAARRAGWEV
jgi:AraC-like DNA-binding protein